MKVVYYLCTLSSFWAFSAAEGTPLICMQEGDPDPVLAPCADSSHICKVDVDTNAETGAFTGFYYRCYPGSPIKIYSTYTQILMCDTNYCNDVQPPIQCSVENIPGNDNEICSTIFSCVVMLADGVVMRGCTTLEISDSFHDPDTGNEIIICKTNNCNSPANMPLKMCYSGTDGGLIGIDSPVTCKTFGKCILKYDSNADEAEDHIRGCAIDTECDMTIEGGELSCCVGTDLCNDGNHDNSTGISCYVNGGDSGTTLPSAMPCDSGFNTCKTFFNKTQGLVYRSCVHSTTSCVQEFTDEHETHCCKTDDCNNRLIRQCYSGADGGSVADDAEICKTLGNCLLDYTSAGEETTDHIRACTSDETCMTDPAPGVARSCCSVPNLCNDRSFDKVDMGPIAGSLKIRSSLICLTVASVTLFSVSN